MNRSLTWTAAAAATFVLAVTAQAQSSVSLYGLVEMSAGRLQNAGAPKAYVADSGNMTTSFLGFKGTEDLGGGLKARFAIEHFLRADSGQAGRFTGDAFWARNAYVGLSGSFGTVTLGRNTNPFFVSTLAFNAIGDSFGFSPSIRQVLTPAAAMQHNFLGDTGWSNSLLYSSDTYAGFALNLIGNLAEGSAGATGRNYGANATYFGGPIGASLAAQRVQNNFGGTSVAGTRSQDSFQGGFSYDFSVAKLFLQATQERTKATRNTKMTIYGVGGSVPIGAGSVIAQYGFAKTTVPQPAPLAGLRTTNRTLTVGYDYNLSKRTDVYAIAMQDRISRLNNGNTLEAGIRMRF
jgi:predicted porin